MKAKQYVLFPTWILQFILILDSIFEAILVFFVLTVLTGMLFGKSISNGVSIYGAAATAPPLLTIVYFVVMYRYGGGTIAMRLNRRLARKRYYK